MCPAENFSPAGFLLAAQVRPRRPACPRRIEKTYRPETRLVHAGTLRSQFGETSEALFLTQGYVYPSAEECEARFSGKAPGYVYSRYSNPTMAMFEQRMAALEGAEAARSTATGMAAVTTALMGLVRAGDHVVAAKALFGSCRWVIEEWLPRFGVTSTLVDGKDLGAWKTAVRPNTKAFFLETPTNPTLEVYRHRRRRRDRAQGRRQARGRQRVRDAALPEPARARRRRAWSIRRPSISTARAACSAASSWRRKNSSWTTCTSSCGRPDRRCRRSMPGCCSRDWRPCRCASSGRPKPPARLPTRSPGTRSIARLIYPGRTDHPQAAIVKKQMKAGSTLCSFEIKGGKEGAFRFLNALQLIGITNNLGDAKSLITHPTTTTHQRLTPEQRAELGIGDGLVRFSAGLEHPRRPDRGSADGAGESLADAVDGLFRHENACGNDGRRQHRPLGGFGDRDAKPLARQA